MRRQVVDSKRDSICETQSVQNQVWRQEEQLSWVIMACCSLVQCSRRARRAAWARLTEATAGYQVAACHSSFKWLKPAKIKFSWSHFTSLYKQVSTNSHNFRFRFACASYSKFVKSLQAQVWSVNFHDFFFNLIFWRDFDIRPKCGARGGCCRSNCEAHCQSQSKKATLHLIEKRSRLTLSYWLSCKITILSAS